MNRRQFIQQTSAAGIFISTMPYHRNNIGKSYQQSVKELPYRQIHLDFHTSGKIKNIAADFNPEEFADTLQEARVNSINCFAKGHHGWLYYYSDQFKNLVHPHLEKNLLKLQTDVLRQRGINVTAYVSLQTDYQTAINHPEWRVVNPDGSLSGGAIGNPSFWKTLCLNSPYVDLLKAQIKDVVDNVEIDGFWLDIIKPRDCSCKYCKARMEKRGLDVDKESDRMINAEEVMIEFEETMSNLIWDLNPDYLIYYNSGHVSPFHRKVAQYYSHFELESLSSSVKWGYPFFQNEARYARGLGKEIVGMTGKFHSTWGDFHSFKNKYALEFDCFQSLALNGKCSIGDQLHPEGKIDPHTYDLIGSVYKQVEEKEPWCKGTKAITEIGVFHQEEFIQGIDNSHPPGLWGANKMLLEGGFQYDVIDTQSDFSKYKLLVLPDRIPVEGSFKTKLEKYTADGGALIVSFESGMDKNKSGFASSIFGVEKAGEGPVDSKGDPVRGKFSYGNNYAQYIIPTGDIGKGLRETEYIMYVRGVDVNASSGSEVLIKNTLSYFDRKGEYFSSHMQTPSSGKEGLPAIVKNGNVVYFSHPVFTLYNHNAAPWYKKLVHNAIEILMPDRLMKTNGPTTLITALNEQRDKKRIIAHFLHYIPMQRGLEFQTLEEIIPVFNLDVEINLNKNITNVKLVPEQESIKFNSDNGTLKFTIPKLEGHQMVEII